MMNEFANILLRTLDPTHIDQFNSIVSKLYYPNLVLVSGKRLITVINVEANEDNGCTADYHHEANCNIIDVTIWHQFLWVLLETSQIIVIDILNDTKVTAIIDDISNCNFKSLAVDKDQNNIYLVNNNEIYYHIPNSVRDMLMKITQEVIHIRIEKVQDSISLQSEIQNCLCYENNVTGLKLDIDRGALIVECPLTGLRAVAASAQKGDWKNVLPWGNMALLADTNNIWIVKLSDAQVHMALTSDVVTYTLLASYKDSFYYLAIKENEVCVSL